MLPVISLVQASRRGWNRSTIYCQSCQDIRPYPVCLYTEPSLVVARSLPSSVPYRGTTDRSPPHLIVRLELDVKSYHMRMRYH